jgi:hypothetical protein
MGYLFIQLRGSSELDPIGSIIFPSYETGTFLFRHCNSVTMSDVFDRNYKSHRSNTGDASTYWQCFERAL